MNSEGIVQDCITSPALWSGNVVVVLFCGIRLRLYVQTPFHPYSVDLEL